MNNGDYRPNDLVQIKQIKDFLDAAYYGDVKAIQRCLEDDVDVNARNKEGSGALHMALYGASNNTNQILKLLLDAGADPTVRNSENDTPLQLACRRALRDIHYYPVIQTFLDRSLGALLHYNSNDLLLHASCRVHVGDNDKPNHLNLIRELLHMGVPVDAVDLNSRTALHEAVAHQNHRAVDLLLANNASPNPRDDTGTTPLHLAAAAHDHISAEQLLAAGADTGIRDGQGNTPLQLAMSAPDTPTAVNMQSFLDVLFKHSCPDPNQPDNWLVLCNLYHDTSSKPANYLPNNRRYAMKMYLNAGLDIDKQDSAGNTLLHRLCRARAHNDDLTTLLAAGATVAARNNLGRTPLHVYVAGTVPNINKAALSLLLKHGAPTNAADDQGRTPMHYVFTKDHMLKGQLEDIVDLLIGHGADPYLPDTNGLTPFDYAANIGRQAMLPGKTPCRATRLQPPPPDTPAPHHRTLQ